MPRYAAIDIGSNSIRMEAAEVVPGQPARVLASEREVTRLGESVFRTGSVNEEAMRATCVVLARMAGAYRKLDVVGVRAVATSAIRDTSNQKAFLTRASEAVGAAVEIISGREEARLIHLGVESNWPQPAKRVLIVDIGGGSAEIVAAEAGGLRESFSKPLGAVRLREVFLRDDPPVPLQLHQMREYIQEKLDAPVRRLGHSGWDRAIATSATASAVASAVARVPRSQARPDRPPARSHRASAQALPQAGGARILPRRRKITGIGPRRAEIIVPGVAVLLEFLQEFHLPAVYYSRAGVRDGIITDLAARNVGARAGTASAAISASEVEQMGRRYGVALAHARKVAELGHTCCSPSFQPLHQLPPHCGKLLEAAAYLHDAGHFVVRFQPSQAFVLLVNNSDMPGFTSRERALIANLCRYHRKSMPTPMHSNWQALNADDKKVVLLLIPLLRLADNLDVSHEERIAIAGLPVARWPSGAANFFRLRYQPGAMGRRALG